MKLIPGFWWKATAVLLLIYTLISGFLTPVPAMPILHETIRNLYFHVTMWFTMIILFGVSVVYSIRHLAKFNASDDLVSSQAAHTGMLFGICGLLTGMLWAKFTWGAFWVNDTKLNGSAAAMLVYAAYFILRNSIDDDAKRGRLAAVYNIFAFVLMLVFIMVLPRMTDSLHPGNGGNPAFSNYDLDRNMRLVFYPAVAGWALLGTWIMTLRIRIRKLELKNEYA